MGYALGNPRKCNYILLPVQSMVRRAQTIYTKFAFKPILLVSWQPNSNSQTVPRKIKPRLLNKNIGIKCALISKYSRTSHCERQPSNLQVAAKLHTLYTSLKAATSPIAAAHSHW
jgi:hypothetical protein